MKQYTTKSLVLAATFVAAILQFAAAAPRLQPLPLEAMARFGATHVIEINAADFAAVTSTNTGWSVTNVVTKPCSIRFAGYVLDQQFNDDKTYTNATATTTNSITVSCGDSNSTNRWISSVQVAYDQTPTVTGSFGTDYTVTTIGYATNALTSTVSSPVLNAQTSDVTLSVSVSQPGPNTTLSALTRGKARFFFRIIGSGWQVK